MRRFSLQTKRTSSLDCNSEILQQAVGRIKAYWLGENMPEGWTDVLINNWATTERIGLPFWRRIWRMLDHEIHVRGWWQIPHSDRQQNPVFTFLLNENNGNIFKFIIPFYNLNKTKCKIIFRALIIILSN